MIGTVTPSAVQMIAELEEVRVLEKQLCDDEVGALLDLVAQAIPVHVTAFLARDVPFRKPGDADGESAGFADELHELIRELEAARRRRESPRRPADRREAPGCCERRARARARESPTVSVRVAFTHVRWAIAVSRGRAGFDRRWSASCRACCRRRRR